MCSNWLPLRGCIKRLEGGAGTSQSGNHNPGHSQIDKGLTAGMRSLKIARESTVSGHPGIGSFHYPSSGEDVEALGNNLVPINFLALWNPDASNACPRVFDNFQANTQGLLNPRFKFASIASISPDQLEARQLSVERCQ